VASKNLKQTQNNTREQILSATLGLFSQKGYFNTSVRDIARESGVSIGSLYHHFKDKEGIASAMYNKLLDRMIKELSQIKASNNTAHDRCHGVIVFLFEMTEQEPEVMEFMLSSKHRDFLPDEKPVCSSAPFEMMREIVKDGMVSDEIQLMDLMVASSCLYGPSIRMITSRLDGLIDKPLQEYLDAIWSASWKAVAT
jgi:AcrR family transcriptional regulator